MAFSISRELLSSFTLREHLSASGSTSLHPLCRSSTSYYLLPTTTYSLPYTTQLHLSGFACDTLLGPARWALASPAQHAKMALNLYHRRLVRDSDSKACWICYKPTATVLSAPDNSDWFFICPGHLSDPKFAISKDAEDLSKKQKDAEIEKEIEAVKKEFQEKMKKKMDRQRIKEWEKEGKNVKEEQKKLADLDEKKLKEEEEAKLKELEEKKKKQSSQEKVVVDGPRIFELHKNFWQMRVQKKAQAAAAKRQAERMRNPTFFPSVPKDP